MRTTLSIDDDVMAAARAMAVAQGKSVGEIISALSRAALKPAESGSTRRNGILLMPGRHQVEPVTLEVVNRLRDEQP